MCKVIKYKIKTTLLKCLYFANHRSVTSRKHCNCEQCPVKPLSLRERIDKYKPKAQFSNQQTVHIQVFREVQNQITRWALSGAWSLWSAQRQCSPWPAVPVSGLSQSYLRCCCCCYWAFRWKTENQYPERSKQRAKRGQTSWVVSRPVTHREQVHNHTIIIDTLEHVSLLLALQFSSQHVHTTSRS